VAEDMRAMVPKNGGIVEVSNHVVQERAHSEPITVRPFYQHSLRLQAYLRSGS